jgi:hypothetical protein
MRQKSDAATKIQRRGVTPDYFTMIPNMALIDLKPVAYKLLAVYLDMSSTGEIYAKNETVASRLGVSVNTMKSARKELFDNGYILLALGKDGKDTCTADVTIQLDLIWQKNHDRMVSKTDDRVSNSDTLSDKRVSNSDTNKQYLKEIQSIPQEKEKESSTPVGIDTAPIDYDKLLEEIGITFKAHGSEAKLVATLLMGTSKAKGWIENKLDVPMNHTELKAYRQWYQTVYSDRTMVKKPIKINSSVQEWRTSSEYQAYIKQSESVNVSSAPVPTMTALDHKPSPDWIAAQPDYGTPEENAELDRMIADLVASKRSTKLVGKIPPTLRDVS